MDDAVWLSSGGLDSLLCLHLLRERGTSALPTFVNYGQINCSKELGSLLTACDKYDFPKPVIFDVSGFGAVILLSRVPESGKIHIVQNGLIRATELVLAQWPSTRLLSSESPETPV